MRAILHNDNSERTRVLVKNGNSRRRRDRVDPSSREKKLLRDLRNDTLSIEEVELLMKSGTNPYYKNALGNTAMHIAVANRRSDIVELLLKYNSPVDIPNIHGNTPLHIAVMNYKLNESESTLRVILQQKVRRECINNKLETPLSIAVQKCAPKLIEILVQHGTDLLDPDKCGVTPICTVLNYCNANVIEILKTLEGIQGPLRLKLKCLHRLKIHRYILKLVKKLSLREISVASILESTKILIKYTILKHIGGYYFWRNVQKGDILQEIWDYIQDCLFVVRAMKAKRIQKKISLYHFVVYGAGFTSVDREFYSHVAINYMLYKTDKSKYIIYHDILAAQLCRIALVDRVVDFKIFTKNRCSQNVVLNKSTVRVLASYLSNIDIFNLIKVYSQFNKSFLKV